MKPSDLAAYLKELPKGYLRLEIVQDGTTVRLEMAPDAWLPDPVLLPPPTEQERVKAETALPENLAHLSDLYGPDYIAAIQTGRGQ